MANSFYTLFHKRVDCPAWMDKLTVTAKYRFSDPDDPYRARFVSATCEVLENLKLPVHKREKRLALYQFCRLAGDCPLLKDFPEEIDVRKGLTPK